MHSSKYKNIVTSFKNRLFGVSFGSYKQFKDIYHVTSGTLAYNYDGERDWSICVFSTNPVDTELPATFNGIRIFDGR